MTQSDATTSTCAQPLLSISLLSSGRPETLWRCLNSLQPIRDRIPCEVIIVDTGCPAEIRARMADYADTILDFTWCDDFSAARNVGLSAARGAWFLYIDDDEWFIETDPIVDFFQSGHYLAYKNACYIQRNYHDPAGQTWRDVWVGRMIRLTPRPTFQGRIHEYLTSPAGDDGGTLLHALVSHYGYLYETEESRQAHFKRNSSLLLQTLADDPADHRARTHLIQEYFSIRDYEQVLVQCREGVQRIGDSDSITHAALLSLGYFYVAEIQALRLLDREEEALAAIRRDHADTRLTDYYTARLCIHEAALSYYQGDHERCMEAAARYHQIDTAISGDDALLYAQGAQQMGDCFTAQDRSTVCALAMAAGLAVGDESRMLADMDQISWEEPAADMAAQLLAVPLMERLHDESENPRYEAVRARLHRSRAAAERVLHALLDRICDEGPGMSYGELRQAISLYIQEALTIYGPYFTDEAFSEPEQPHLPPEC
ncbi:MAG: glycosyltransferase, partial [Butyrivibrio sp.]|nr:glycosyltransferase [Butyrivibrio sp.]